MKKLDPTPPVARGPGPRWVRFGLVGVALVYFVMLMYHPTEGWWVRHARPAAFFTQATSLFPNADTFALEYRLEVWACGRQWEALDPRPYFPIQPDDKESRFQRFGYFYARDRAAMQALDSYISAHHAAGIDDGVAGPIGGIRVVKVVRALPFPGDAVERYHFDPFAPISADQRRDLYYTPESQRKRRCASS
jgi:hypothetical protein